MILNVIIIKKEINEIKYSEIKKNLMDLLKKVTDQEKLMKKSKIMKILVVVLSIFIITGCTTTLKDPKTKKVVTYEDEKVKITLNENILCKPTNKGLVKEYNKYKKIIWDQRKYF